MKKSIYAATAVALAVVLSGCGSQADTTVEKKAGLDASVEASAAPVVDPLDRLPEHPFGLDAEAIVADPERFGIQLHLDESQGGLSMAGALTAFLQIHWLANERQIYLGGPDTEKIQGTLRDAEHFVAAEHLTPLREKAERALAYTALHEQEGDEATPLTEEIYYPFHLGSVAAPDSEVPAEVTELRKERWPDPSEAEEYVWLQVDGEDTYSFFPLSSEIPLTPRIYDVTGKQEGHPADVHIFAYLDYEMPLSDGRTAVASYSSWYGMRNVNGEWKLDGWKTHYNDTKPTVTIKK